MLLQSPCLRATSLTPARPSPRLSSLPPPTSQLIRLPLLFNHIQPSVQPTQLRCVRARASASAPGGSEGSNQPQQQQGGSWLQGLMQQPLVARLARRIPELLRAAREQVLLFMWFGILAAISLVIWAKGEAVHREKPYVFRVHFPEAEGIERGVPLRLKGVKVGEVQGVHLDMSKGVTADVEVFLGQTLIPKHPQVKVEYNRTGMMSVEPYIDISVPSTTSPSAVRTLSKKALMDLQRRQQHQQQQQEEDNINAADAATAVASASRPGEALADVDETASTDDARHGSETGSEEASSLGHSLAERGRRQTTSAWQEAPQGKEASTSQGQSTNNAASKDASPDFTKSEFIQPGDIVYGKIGGSTDILCRMTVKNNRGPGKIQPIR